MGVSLRPKSRFWPSAVNHQLASSPTLVFLRVDLTLTDGLRGPMCRNPSPHSYTVPTDDPDVDGTSLCLALEICFSASSQLLIVCDMKFPPSPVQMHKDSSRDSCWASALSLPPPLRDPLGSSGLPSPHFLIKGKKGTGNSSCLGLPVPPQSSIMGQRPLGINGF